MQQPQRKSRICKMVPSCICGTWARGCLHLLFLLFWKVLLPNWKFEFAHSNIPTLPPQALTRNGKFCLYYQHTKKSRYYRISSCFSCHPSTFSFASSCARFGSTYSLLLRAVPKQNYEAYSEAQKSCLSPPQTHTLNILLL